MKLEVCETPKIVYFWLSQTERNDENLICAVTTQRKAWNEKGYKTCTFVSGDGDLVSLTKDLLVRNKKALAECEG